MTLNYFPSITFFFLFKSYKLYQCIHSIFVCSCYFEPSMSQLALPATTMPQVVWAEALQQASHWHPEGTTGTASLRGTFLAPGLACFPLITSTQPDFVLAFRTSCKSHEFDRVEEKGLGYLGLEDNSKGYTWMIPILYQQLSKRVLPTRQNSRASV